MKVLFEVLTEELPARELLKINSDIMISILDKYSIDYTDVDVYYTPRRIAVELKCQSTTKQQKQKLTGPPKTVCFDNNGKPTKALLSFLEKNNANIEECFFEETKKGAYACVYLKSQSQQVKELLCTVFSDFLSNLPFSVSMRWGNGTWAFLRPVHNIVLLADDEVVECSMFGCQSSPFTYGHRFLSNYQIDLRYRDYKEILKEHYIIVNQEQRKEMIKSALTAFSGPNKHYEIDEQLLDEVANLVEYPHCLEGLFEKDFLELPQEVLISSMKSNQKYFYSLNSENKLSNNFCVVSNIFTDDDELIIKGNERVLKARFRDAAFFYQEDLKVKLSDLVEKLKTMLFHEKLGSMYDKVMRIVELSAYIATLIGALIEPTKRAAYLSKADLLTHMVYEFPEVQGIMGSIYAKKQSEDDLVSQCIFEQYLPKDEAYPKTKEGIALSLADKFDLIAGGFIAELKSTGNKDPYGLRRAALSIIKILLNTKLNFNIVDVTKFALTLYEKHGLSINEETLYNIIDFIKARFVNMFEEQFEIVKSVVEVDFSDIYDAFLKIEALKIFYNESDSDILLSIKRVFNIVPSGFEKTNVDESMFVFDEESKFYSYIKSLKFNLETFLKSKDYLSYLKKLVDKSIISSFFDKVLIMDKDEKIKNNRLALLNNYRDLVLKVADFKYLSI